MLDIELILEKYSNFFLDTSSNYLDSYSSSKFMITDVSGTAYTYAMLTKKPVFFFSKSEDKINSSNYKNLNGYYYCELLVLCISINVLLT